MIKGFGIVEPNFICDIAADIFFCVGMPLVYRSDSVNRSRSHRRFVIFYDMFYYASYS